MMSIDKKRIRSNEKHDYSMEENYFTEFVVEALKSDGYVLNTEGQRYGCDAIIEKGSSKIFHNDRSYFNEKTYLLVKYSNKLNEIKDLVDRWNEFLGHPLVIVSLVDERELYSFQSFDRNITILGRSFVKRIAHSHEKEWWLFVASCSPTDEVAYDDAKDAVCFSFLPLASLDIDTDIYLTKEQILSLSLISETQFKKMREGKHNPAIIIGNGVSIPFGTDTWSGLTNSLFDYLSPSFIQDKDKVRKAIGNTNYSCTSMAKHFIDSSKYKKAMHDSLYRKYDNKMHKDHTLIRSISKVKRAYEDLPLLTYNYDDFVERDYEMYAHSTLGSVTTKEEDELYCSKQKIAHVHGCLPFDEGDRKSSPLILTQEEYYEAYSDKGSWTATKQREILSQHTTLFVGSSMSDLFQMSIIDEVRKGYYKRNNNDVWKCFALLCLEGMGIKDIATVYDYYLSKGIYVIFTNSFSDLPRKLLDLFGLEVPSARKIANSN